MSRLRDDQTVYVIAEFDVFDARDVKELSVSKAENEWLLLPQTKLVVTKITDLKKEHPTISAIRYAPKPTKGKLVYGKQKV